MNMTRRSIGAAALAFISGKAASHLAAPEPDAVPGPTYDVPSSRPFFSEGSMRRIRLVEDPDDLAKPGDRRIGGEVGGPREFRIELLPPEAAGPPHEPDESHPRPLSVEFAAPGRDMIFRNWTEDGAAGCRLCKVSCNAFRNASRKGEWTCIVTLDPARPVAKAEDAAMFACRWPHEHS